MMLLTIDNKLLNLKIFCSLIISSQNQHNFKIMVKLTPPSGPCAPPGETISLSKILILVSSISYLSMVKKAKWFFDGKKNQFLKIMRLKIEIFQSKRNVFNFLLAITLDTFMLVN